MDITMIVVIGIFIIIGIFTYLISPLIKSKVSLAVWINIEFWVKKAVRAFEQLYQDPGVGGKRKEEVIKFLKSKGLYIDMDEIDILLESEVFAINNPEVPAPLKLPVKEE